MRKITFCLIFLNYFFVVAQKAPKVDLDKYSFGVSYQQLPSVYVPFADRTYFSNTIISNSIYNYYPDGETINEKTNISGWKKVDSGATVKVTLNLIEFSQKNTEIVSRLVEEKDKDGKVTKSYNLYQYVITYEGIGSCIVAGPKAEKEAPKKEEGKEAAPVNRFLQAKVSSETKSGLSDSSGREYPINESYTYKSKESTDRNEIEKHYKLNKEELYATRLREYVAQLIYRVNNFNDRLYGFPSISENENLWIIDSKEEEGATQKEAIQAVKTIFAEMKADVPITVIAQNMNPLIDYFESLKTKYTGDDKGSKKIRYSAFFNLGKIYYYLDQPEKAIKEGEGLIANDYDKRDGERIIKEANTLLEKFNSIKLFSRHNPSFN